MLLYTFVFHIFFMSDKNGTPQVQKYTRQRIPNIFNFVHFKAKKNCEKYLKPRNRVAFSFINQNSK